MAEPCTDPRAQSSFSFYCRKGPGKKLFCLFCREFIMFCRELILFCRELMCILPWADFILPWADLVLPWVYIVLPWINFILPWRFIWQQIYFVVPRVEICFAVTFCFAVALVGHRKVHDTTYYQLQACVS